MSAVCSLGTAEGLDDASTLSCKCPYRGCKMKAVIFQVSMCRSL